MGKLTKRGIDEFKFPYDKLDKKGRPVKVAFKWDSETRGFGARFTRKGKCTYIAQGRINGQVLRITIGSTGIFTVEQARDAAREHLRNMRLGINPQDQKREEEASKITLRKVADEYMARPGKLKDSSSAEIERHVTTTFETVQHKPILSITEDYCRRRYREMLTGGLRGDRENGSPGQANQSMSILRALINFAARQYKKADGTPLITHNPVSALRDHWVTLRERDTYVPAGKIGEVWNWLSDFRDRTYQRATLSSIELTMFMLLTGSRINEPQELTWDRVNLSDEAKDCWWHLPDPKNRRPIWLPLSKQAANLLRERPRVNGNPYVFPGKNPGSHVSGAREIWLEISRIVYGKRPEPNQNNDVLSSHDARRSHINYGVMELGLDLYKMELLTSHKPKTVTTKHYLETKRLQYLYPETQKVSDWIEMKAAISRSQADGSNVVQLRA